MKKLLITVLIVLFTITLKAQKKFRYKLDSISIYHPKKDLKLKTFKKLEELDRNLNKLNDSLKTNEFIIHYYRNDGVIMRCRVRPIVEPKTLTI